MENLYHQSHRQKKDKNMKFCTDILQYIQLESENYDTNNKEKSIIADGILSDTAVDTAEKEAESKSELKECLFHKESQLKLERTKSSSCSTIDEEQFVQTFQGSSTNQFLKDDFISDSDYEIDGDEFSGCEDDLVVTNDRVNHNHGDHSLIKDDGYGTNLDETKPAYGKPLDKRKSWIREKSQSSRELPLWQPNETTSGAESKIVIENVSQCVEARPRSHHFLWTIPDPGSQKLNWHKPPLTVLVVKKIYDESVLGPFKELISWLVEVRKMIVFVESNVFEDDVLGEDSMFQKYRGRLQTFKDVKEDLTDKIDFIICLGGDGTLLHASSLFQQSCPPVMAFHQGSLGFLTPFSFDNFQTLVTNVLEGHASLLLRYRLKCVICKEDSELGRVTRIKNIDRSSPCANSQILVLNEVVVDRGSSSYICNIDLYVEGRHVTSVQGDGLIISTPTGSTAYAVAAGASMIHPNVPAIMITPICPHSLSFRPIVVPAGVELKIMLSPEARGPAMVSFDGRNRQEIQQGDSVRITTAQFPLPAVCAKDQIDDWFDRLAECLHWNVRKPQKMLTVSSNNSDHSNHSNHSNHSMSNSQNNSTDSIEEGGS